MKVENLEFIKKLIVDFDISEEPETLKKLINLSSDSLKIIKEMNQYDVVLTIYFLRNVNSEMYKSEELFKIIKTIKENKTELSSTILVNVFLATNFLKHPFYDEVVNKLNEIGDIHGFNACVKLLSLKNIWRDEFSIELLESLNGITKLQDEIIENIFSVDVPYEHNGESYKTLISLAKKVKSEKQKDIFKEILNSVGFVKEPRITLNVLSLVIKTDDFDVLNNILNKYNNYYERAEEPKSVYDKILDSVDPYRNVTTIGELVDIVTNNGDTDYLLEKLSSFGDKEITCRTRVKVSSPFNKEKSNKSK